MSEHEGGASPRDSLRDAEETAQSGESAGSADSAAAAQARERAARIAAQRAAADAAIAAVAGGKQALSAMTSAAAAAAKSASEVESKRKAEREALAAEEAAEAAGEAGEVEAGQEEATVAEVSEVADVSEVEPDVDEHESAVPTYAPTRAPEPEIQPDYPAPASPERPPARTARIAPPPPAPTRLLGPAEPLDESIARWLAAEGAPQSFTDVLRAEFGEGAEAGDRLTENPWLILELPGVRPTAADNLARHLLDFESPEQLRADPRRGRALVSALLQRAARLGHTASPADAVSRDLAEFGVPDPAGAIADAVEIGAALVFADRIALAAEAEKAQPADDAAQSEAAEFEAVDTADDDDPETMLTSPYTLLALDNWAFLEQSAAEAVQRLLATATPTDRETADGADRLTPAAGDAAEAERVDRVTQAAAECGVTLVTGATVELPGLVAAAFPDAVLATPSPAGLRALAAAGFAAVDLRALSEHTERFEEATVVVVADAQLVPLELGVDLLELLPDDAHLVLCGDPGSLPATGPGRLLRDLLEIDDPEFGGALPRVELKRRPTGPLTSLVDAVRYGGLPPMDLLGDGQTNEVKIIPVRDPDETRLRTVQLVADSIPRALGFTGDQVQAIALREKGPASAEDLNAALKERLNPGPGVCAGFDAGDRVVVREGGRLQELGLLGGETGTVVAADGAGLRVRFDPPHGDESTADESDGDSVPAAMEPVAIDASLARALRHAWVLTLREAQGGRWPAVVAVFDGGSAAALTRSAVIGAFACAGSHLSVVHGAGSALAEAVEQRPQVPCRTRLAQALRN